MARKLKPATRDQVIWLGASLHNLQNAREAAELAGCPMLERKIRSAIKSCGGAIRHMERRINAAR